MRGYLRALLANAERRICKTNLLTDDRGRMRVTLADFHGKEGVDGSSPEEGSAKAACGYGAADGAFGSLRLS